MKKILVPVDFSEESMNALDAACSLASGANSEIYILHVIEDPNVALMKVTGEDHYDSMENLYVKLLIDKTKEKLETIVSDAKFNDLTVSYKIDIGNAYSSIVAHIAIHEATLIIMGSNGVSGLNEILVGSIADKVVRHASCPVMVIKGNAQIANINDIVFATDLQDDQNRVIEELKKVQDFYRAHIHIINIATSDKAFRGDVNQKMKQFAKDHSLEDYSLVVERDDDVADSILDYASDKNAGLVAFGTHDRHGLLHLLASKVSKNLTNHAHLPIWTMAIK